MLVLVLYLGWFVVVLGFEGDCLVGGWMCMGLQCEFVEGVLGVDATL